MTEIDVAVEELRKIPAFFRRDLGTLWSYRLAFVTDWLSLLVQSALFYFVGRLVDPTRLPSFGGSRVSYMDFVAVGIAISGFVEVALLRIMQAIRNEQVMGTLEALLVTPTALTTIQLGSVMYDLAYVPVRTAVFFALVSVGFGVHIHLAGLLPALALMIVFIPFVWGLGVLGAAGTVTFRRGAAAGGFLTVIYSLSSGVYFPVSVLPGWVQPLTRRNPLTLAVSESRATLLGHAGWSGVASTIGWLAIAAAVALTIGMLAFRAALGRERRRGTLGLY